MKQWLYNSGAEYDKVKIINEKENYRCAVATKSIKKDQIIVFIPKSQLITLQLAKQNIICQQIVKNNALLLSPKHSILSIFLLEQKASGNSKFKPYIDILPSDHSCFPINFTTQELTELIGSSFLYQIRQKVIDLKKDHQLICLISQEFAKKYTFKQFCWARMMVGSRVFGVFIDGIKTQILTPFADMLNHKVPKQTVWNYSQQKKGFYIQSLKNISIGQQLFDSYGKKCNSRFLLNYGFVVQQSDRNQICVKIDLDQNDPILQKKIIMLKLTKDQALSKICRITKFIEENNFFQMMGYLRFKNITKIQTLNLLQKISNIQKSNESYKPSRTPPTTMQVQIKIWNELKSLCQSYLKNYLTTLEEDQNLLKNKTLTYNIINIIMLRMGQKKLYNYYINVAKIVIETLQLGYLQARQKARKSLQFDYYRYIEKILNLMPHQKNQFFRKKHKLQENQQFNQEPEINIISDEDQQMERQ